MTRVSPSLHLPYGVTLGMLAAAKPRLTWRMVQADGRRPSTMSCLSR
jgi:hypothetical protein